MTTARKSGHAVEDVSQRTETTQVFANPDGTWTAEEASEPVRVKQADGNWVKLDLMLEPVDGGFAPRSAIGGLEVSGGGDKTFAAMTVDGKQLDWKWPDVLPAPTIHENSATYADVVDGGDLVVTATPSGFRHDIVLRHAPASPVAFQIPVVTEDSKLVEQQDGELSVKTKSGDELVSAAQPVMYDAQDPESGESTHRVAIDTTVTPTATGAVMKLDPAESFLHDPTVTYPVTIDPTFDSTNPDDTWIYNTGPTAVHPNDPTLYAGTPNAGTTKYRTFVRFNGNVEPWDGAAVSSATLSLRNFNSSGTNCDGAAVEVRRVAAAWDPGSLNWNNQPTTSITNAVSTIARRGGSTGCAPSDIWWNVTGMVQDMANWAGNYGFRVAGADETKTGTYREYRAAGTSNPPYLTVTYNHVPTVPAGLSVTPGRGSSTRSTVPTLSAVISDPDGGAVTGEFQILDSAGTLIWGGNAATSSGSLASLDVPAELLEFGSAYTLRVRSLDGLAASGYAVKNFTVDPLASVVPASPCADGCQAIPNVPLMSAVALGPNESRLVDVALPGVDPTTIDRVLMTASASNWSGDGSITVSVPDYPDAQPPTLSYGSANAPSPGVSTTVETYTSYDSNQVKVTNNASSSVVVTLTAYGWFAAPDLSADDAAEAEVDPSEVDPYGDVVDQVDDGGTVVVAADHVAHIITPAQAPAETAPTESPVPCPNGSDPGSECSVVVDTSVTPTQSDLDALASAPDTDVVESGTTDSASAPSSGASSTDTFVASAALAPEQMVAANAAPEPDCSNIVQNAWVLRGRYLACKNGIVTVTQYQIVNGVREPIGFASMWVQQRIHLHWKSATIDQDYREVFISGSGTGSEISNDHKSMCSPCDYDNGQPWRSTSPYAINAVTRATTWDRNHRTVTLNPDPAKTVPVEVGIEQRTYIGQSLATPNYKSTYGRIRCDQVYYLNAGAGCVLTRVIPTLEMSKSGLAPATAKHISYAQTQKALPGAKWQWGGTGDPLTRKFWFGATNRNRVRKDALCKGLARPSGYQCDEYPFASTDQGCAVACHVKMIPGDDNQRGGNILNNKLYRAYRVIDGDAFWVRILP